MIEIPVPIRLRSEANLKQNPYVANKRHKEHKMLVRTFLNVYYDNSVQLPCVITLTRCAPRKLDSDDNLPMAFKYVKDEISDYLLGNVYSLKGKRLHGRNDDNEKITWKYSQEKTIKELPYIKIKIEPCNITPA